MFGKMSEKTQRENGIFGGEIEAQKLDIAVHRLVQAVLGVFKMYILII